MSFEDSDVKLKKEVIKVRVSKDMKRKIILLARSEEKDISYIVRYSIQFMLDYLGVK